MPRDKSRIVSGFFQFCQGRRHPFLFQERVQDLVIPGERRHDLHPEVPALPDPPVVVAVFAAEAAEMLVFAAVEGLAALQAGSFLVNLFSVS